MSDPRISHEAGQPLWNRLAAAWRMSPDCEDWYPLAASDRDDVIAFQSTHFIAALGTGVLQRLLRERGVERVVEFREGGDTLELAVKDLDPEYGGEEGYW